MEWRGPRWLAWFVSGPPAPLTRGGQRHHEVRLTALSHGSGGSQAASPGPCVCVPWLLPGRRRRQWVAGELNMRWASQVLDRRAWDGVDGVPLDCVGWPPLTLMATCDLPSALERISGSLAVPVGPRPGLMATSSPARAPLLLPHAIRHTASGLEPLRAPSHETQRWSPPSRNQRRAGGAARGSPPARVLTSRQYNHDGAASAVTRAKAGKGLG